MHWVHRPFRTLPRCGGWKVPGLSLFLGEGAGVSGRAQSGAGEEAPARDLQFVKGSPLKGTGQVKKVLHCKKTSILTLDGHLNNVSYH